MPAPTSFSPFPPPPFLRDVPPAKRHALLPLGLVVQEHAPELAALFVVAKRQVLLVARLLDLLQVALRVGVAVALVGKAVPQPRLAQVPSLELSQQQLVDAHRHLQRLLPVRRARAGHVHSVVGAQQIGQQRKHRHHAHHHHLVARGSSSSSLRSSRGAGPFEAAAAAGGGRPGRGDQDGVVGEAKVRLVQVGERAGVAAVGLHVEQLQRELKVLGESGMLQGANAVRELEAGHADVAQREHAGFLRVGGEHPEDV